MKILVNLTSMYGQMTGIGYYTANLVRGLLEHPSIKDIQGVGLAGGWSRKRIARHLRADRKEPVVGSGKTTALLHRARRVVTRIPNMIPLVQGAQGWRLRHFGPGSDFIYWEPSYVLLPHRGPGVVTVHDLSHRKHPGLHPPERVRWMNRHLPVSLFRAVHVIVVSEFTRRELLGCYDLAPDRITVVPPGVGEGFHPSSREQVEPVLCRHGLDWKRYLLSVGTLEPRKNLMGLMRAFQSLPGWMRHRHPLVLVGARGWLEGEIERLASRLEAAGELRWLGYVPRHELPSLYAGALLTGYVSFYEGFGMPVLESMACGTPVLVSNRGALPETAGGAALQADPESPARIAEGLRCLIEDERKRRNLAERGLARAREFTWRGSIDKITDCFKRIADTSPPSNQP